MKRLLFFVIFLYIIAPSYLCAPTELTYERIEQELATNHQIAYQLSHHVCNDIKSKVVFVLERRTTLAEKKKEIKKIKKACGLQKSLKLSMKTFDVAAFDRARTLFPPTAAHHLNTPKFEPLHPDKIKVMCNQIITLKSIITQKKQALEQLPEDATQERIETQRDIARLEKKRSDLQNVFKANTCIVDYVTCLEDMKPTDIEIIITSFNNCMYYNQAAILHDASWNLHLTNVNERREYYQALRKNRCPRHTKAILQEKYSDIADDESYQAFLIDLAAQTFEPLHRKRILARYQQSLEDDPTLDLIKHSSLVDIFQALKSSYEKYCSTYDPYELFSAHDTGIAAILRPVVDRFGADHDIVLEFVPFINKFFTQRGFTSDEINRVMNPLLSSKKGNSPDEDFLRTIIFSEHTLPCDIMHLVIKDLITQSPKHRKHLLELCTPITPHNLDLADNAKIIHWLTQAFVTYMNDPERLQQDLEQIKISNQAARDLAAEREKILREMEKTELARRKQVLKDIEDAQTAERIKFYQSLEETEEARIKREAEEERYEEGMRPHVAREDANEYLGDILQLINDQSTRESIAELEAAGLIENARQLRQTIVRPDARDLFSGDVHQQQTIDLRKTLTTLMHEKRYTASRDLVYTYVGDMAHIHENQLCDNRGNFIYRAYQHLLYMMVYRNLFGRPHLLKKYLLALAEDGNHFKYPPAVLHCIFSNYQMLLNLIYGPADGDADHAEACRQMKLAEKEFKDVMRARFAKPEQKIASPERPPSPSLANFPPLPMRDETQHSTDDVADQAPEQSTYYGPEHWRQLGYASDMAWWFAGWMFFSFNQYESDKFYPTEPVLLAQCLPQLPKRHLVY